jgi:hypothetical protein
MTILNLGRIGDNINLLPVLYSEHLAGRRPTIVTSGKYSDIFDGVSYCDVKRYSGDPVELSHAIGLCQGLPDLRVAQWFMHPRQTRQERNYAVECYRLGGFRDLWRRYPHVFDRRDPVREEKLIQNIKGRPFIAVAPLGISSPFAHSKQLINGLQSRFPEYKILDFSKVVAEKFHDLLGILDATSCLVTIDTAHLWLSNASKCPVVALLNNGYMGSPPSTRTTASFRYGEYHTNQVCDEVEKTLLPAGQTWGIVHFHGNEKRHKIARKSYEKFDNLLDTRSLKRTAIDLGDHRPLRMLKDMLGHALKFASGRDIIIWTNDDVEILDLAPVVDHVRKFGAVSIRRDPSHMGREMMAFRWDWLADRFYNFPDGVMAGPWFDLATAAWIRNHFGWRSDFDNIAKDFYPCEIPNDGIFNHPNDHESTWTPYMTAPASLWNERLWKMEISKQ